MTVPSPTRSTADRTRTQGSHSKPKYLLPPSCTPEGSQAEVHGVREWKGKGGVRRRDKQRESVREGLMCQLGIFLGKPCGLVLR